MCAAPPSSPASDGEGINMEGRGEEGRGRGVAGESVQACMAGLRRKAGRVEIICAWIRSLKLLMAPSGE